MHYKEMIRTTNVGKSELIEKQVEVKVEKQEPIPIQPAQQVIVHHHDQQEVLDKINALSQKIEGLQLSAQAKSAADTILTPDEANQILLQLEHYQDTYFPTLPLNEIQCREFISNIPKSVFEAAEKNFGFECKFDLMNPIFFFYIMCIGDQHNEIMGEFVSVLYTLMNDNVDFIKQMKNEFDQLDTEDSDETEESEVDESENDTTEKDIEVRTRCENCGEDSEQCICDPNVNLGQIPDFVEGADEIIRDSNIIAEAIVYDPGTESAETDDDGKPESPFGEQDLSQLKYDDEESKREEQERRAQAKKISQQKRNNQRNKGKV